MDKFNFKVLYEYARKPAPFEKSSALLWDDEHISKGMLEAHLNPETDAASRKPAFIDASAKWILEYTGLKKGSAILDLGCGPGLYTEKFAKRGYKVTGIDFSRRSIAYAKEQAALNHLDIDYIYQNYLTINYVDKYDLAVLIWCDFGALTNEDRDILLNKVYTAIKPGGYFIFDVFSPNQCLDIREEKTWEYRESGFWRPYPYIYLFANYIYREHDTFEDHHVILDESGKCEVYRIWNHYYTRGSITKLLTSFGYKDINIFSDAAGAEYNDLSKTLCIVAKK